MVVSNLTELEDSELIDRLRSNDLGAWSELINRYGKLVYSIAFQILKNNSDTEDAVQNTFVSLIRYSSKFDKRLPIKPWLARIASAEAMRLYNTKKNNHKKETVRMNTNNDSIYFKKNDASEIMAQKEIEVMVKKAIELLPETSRVALTLYYVGGMNQNEIAKELGLSQFSISEKIKVGLEKVKIYLKNAGVHASIMLSPNLIQESIVSSLPPSEFISKLTSQFPSASQIAQVSLESLRFGQKVAYKKIIAIRIISLISLSIFVLIAYLNWPFSTAQKIIPVKENSKVEPYTQVKNFNPIDFKDHIPFQYMWKTDVDGGKKAGVMQVVENSNWEIKSNEKGLFNLSKDKINEKTLDGLYLKSFFKQTCLFKGIIKMDSENSEFCFVQSTLNKNQNNAKFDPKFNINANFNRLFGPIEFKGKGEVEFKLFTWPSKTKWNSALFYKMNDPHSRYQLIQKSIDFISQEFMIGVLSNGKVEVIDFEYCILDNNWNPLGESEFKEFSRQFPKDFLPTIVEHK